LVNLNIFYSYVNSKLSVHMKFLDGLEIVVLNLAITIIFTKF